MRVGDAAKQLNISTSTVRKYCREGKINYQLNPAGQRYFLQQDIDDFLGISQPTVKAFYIRSSSGNKQLLTEQKRILTETYGEPEILYKDTASGLNENRPGLKRLIKDAQKGKYTHLYITYEDRLTRFGFSYLEQLLEQNNVEIIVLEQKVKYSLEEELLQDFMNLIASFSGKFYRLRSKKSQQQLLEKATKKLDNA